MKDVPDRAAKIRQAYSYLDEYNKARSLDRRAELTTLIYRLGLKIKKGPTIWELYDMHTNLPEPRPGEQE